MEVSGNIVTPITACGLEKGDYFVFEIGQRVYKCFQVDWVDVTLTLFGGIDAKTTKIRLIYGDGTERLEKLLDYNDSLYHLK